MYKIEDLRIGDKVILDDGDKGTIVCLMSEDYRYESDNLNNIVIREHVCPAGDCPYVTIGIDSIVKVERDEVQKIDLQGQPFFPTPTCPSCGSKEYTMSNMTWGNCRCNKCGKYYFFCFSSSYGIK